MKWSKLPKKDKKHLRDNKIKYKYEFEDQVRYMKEQLKLNPDEYNYVVCWNCIKIAKKLCWWE